MLPHKKDWYRFLWKISSLSLFSQSIQIQFSSGQGETDRFRIEDQQAWILEAGVGGSLS